MTSRPVDPSLGRRVDERYELVERMARGGMATVYEGHDRRLDRRVAVKLMHPHLAESPDFVARFRREARAAARLNHPHVVAVHDQGTWEGASYLVMELIDGPDLRRELRRRGSFTVGEALEIAEQVLDALGAAHRAGLVHRDIKPENVLLAPSEGLRVKVTDFGLARAVSEATGVTTGSVLGTVAYLAPEIVTDGAADQRADVYAVGVMLHELLTGRPPFEGQVAIHVAYRHVNDTVPAPSQTVPWLPQEIDEIVGVLTARDPDERPQDGDAALAFLRRTAAPLDEATLRRRHEVAPPPETSDSGIGGGGSVDPAATSAASPGATAVLTGLHTARLDLTDPGAESAESHPTTALPLGAASDGSAPAGPASNAVAATALAPRRSRTGRILAPLVVLVALVGLGVAGWFTVGPGASTPVPDVLGLSEDAASDVLAGVGVDAAWTLAHHDTVPEGHVVTTDPEPGDRVGPEEVVEVVVSEGVLMVEIPDVTGLEADEARSALADAGLSDVSVTETYHDTVKEGRVIDQSLTAGQRHDHRAPLELTVSQGPAPVTVPDVTGLPQADAQSRLAEDGLTLEVVDTVDHDTVPRGAVISQDPGSGTGSFRGRSVAVTLSAGPAMVEVPEVVGLQVDEALAALESAGFEVDRRDFLGGYFGSVRMQEPAAGTMAPRGTLVVITVV